MANTYKWSRLEPLVKDMDGLENAVVSLVIGMTVSDGDGNSDYMDTTLHLTVDEDNFIPFEELDKAWSEALADEHAEENDWMEKLDKSLEAMKARPVSLKFEWQKPAEPEPEPEE